MDSYWYRDKRLLRAAKEEYGTLEAAARVIGGVHKSTLAQWWHKLGMEELPKGPAVRGPNNSDALQAIYERVYKTRV
jgi:transposase-like protein